MSDLLMDVKEAAARLGCTERFIRRLIQERRIPFIRLGGTKIRISAADLSIWIDQQRVATLK